MSTPPTNIAQPTNQTLSEQEKREAYKNILGDMSSPINSNSTPGTFQPQAGYDVANGSLPGGAVDMDQIMGLMKK